MKRALLATILAAVLSTIGGCIVTPERYYHEYHDGYDHYDYHHGNDTYRHYGYIYQDREHGG